MATTTNYGWTTPDDTALVKDGASAIRTLGSSIDSTLKTQIDAQIPDSLLTTTGDVIYASGASTPARLGIGSTGNVLTVSGGVPTWAAPASGGITLISTTTLTGASVVISSIPATYKNLRLIIRNFLPSATNATINCSFNNDTTASRHQTATGYGGTGTTTFGNTNFQIASASNNTTSQQLAVLDFPDYTNTTTWKNCTYFSITNDPTTSTSFRLLNQMAFYNQTGAISSLLLATNTGTFTSGTAYLYGVQ